MITLLTNGKRFAGWLSINVARTMADLSGSFNLSITDKWAGQDTPAEIRVGDTCKLYIDNDLVLDGYINSILPTSDASSIQLIVNGRDKTSDLVDCYVANKKGQWKGLTVEKLIKELCDPFGIKVRSEIEPGKTVDATSLFKCNHGITVFEAIKKICSLNSCLAIADNNGNIVLTRAGESRASSNLIEGQNILSQQGTYDDSDRFSHYIVNGQQQGSDMYLTASGNPKAITEPTATVIDENVTRYRPIVIIMDGQADTAKCMQRAKWEAAVRAGKSRSFGITVEGWRQSDGKLWMVNQITQLKSSLLGIEEDLLIESVNFMLDETGEYTQIGLVPPDAYKVIPNLKIKKSKQYDQFLKG